MPKPANDNQERVRRHQDDQKVDRKAEDRNCNRIAICGRTIPEAELFCDFAIDPDAKGDREGYPKDEIRYHPAGNTPELHKSMRDYEYGVT